MQKGQRYYMEGHLDQTVGLVYYTVGVEIAPIDATSVANHPQLTPQEMSLRIHQTINARDTTQIEVNNADGGVFLLAWINTDENSEDDYIYTTNITAGGSASNL